MAKLKRKKIPATRPVSENMNPKTKKELAMTKPNLSSTISHVKLWSVPKGRLNVLIGVKNANSTRKLLALRITVVESKRTLLYDELWTKKSKKSFLTASDLVVVCTLTEAVITTDRLHLERIIIVLEIDHLKILDSRSNKRLNSLNQHPNNHNNRSDL